MAELDRLDIVLTASSEDASAKVNKAADAVAKLGTSADVAKLPIMRLSKELGKLTGEDDVEIDVNDKSVSSAAKTMNTLHREMKKISETTVTAKIEASAKDVMGASELDFAKIQRDALGAQYDQMREEGTYTATELMQVAKALRAAERDVIKFTKSEELAERASKSLNESLDRMFTSGNSSLGKEVEKSLADMTDVRPTEIAAGLETPGETDLDQIKEAFNQTLDQTLENAVRETSAISENTEKAFSIGKVQKFGKSITDFVLKPLRKLSEWNQTQSATIITPKAIPKTAAVSPLSDLEQAQKYIDTWDKAKILEQKIEGATAKLADSFNDPNMTADKIARQVEGIQKLQNELDNLGKATDKLSVKWPKFLKSIGRITFYRLVRAAIKAITDAMTVGLQNAYAFSKGVGDRIAPAMDRITSASLKMKNQFGAAFGSLLTAIAPLLIQIANLATRAANAITQLFAALTGGTYLKAKDVSAEWAANTAAGAAAAEEWKNQLLGFDEINRLEAPSDGGGGGGGASALDPSEMFEVANIDPENLFARLGLSFKDVFLDWDINPENFMEKLVVGLTGLTGGIIGWHFGGVGGAIVGTIAGIGLGLLINALTFNHDKVLSEDEIYRLLGLAVAGMTGGIIGFMAGGIPGAAIGVVIGLGVKFILDQISWDEIDAKVTAKVEGWIAKIEDFIRRVIGKITGFKDSIANKFHEIDNSITNSMQNAFDSAVEKLRNLVDRIKSAFNFQISFPHISLPHIQVSWEDTSNSSIAKLLGITAIPKFSLAYYADGGFPLAGELMVAGEAGAEIVGKVNGRTGVASNQEITGIADAVYTVGSQILAAIRDTDRTPKVYLGKRQIAQAVSESQRQTARATGV